MSSSLPQMSSTTGTTLSPMTTIAMTSAGGGVGVKSSGYTTSLSPIATSAIQHINANLATSFYDHNHKYN